MIQSCRAILIGPMLRSAGELRKLLARARAEGGRSLEILIAVDRGADWAALAGVKPDLAIGDWDSLRSFKRIKGVRHITLPADKDRSDLWFALEVARSAGANRIECIGFSGGRADHALAVWLDLAGFGDSGETQHLECIRLLSPEADCYFLTGALRRWRSREPAGQLVSIFALAGEAGGVTTAGLSFPLKNERLRPSSRGLSNTVRNRSCEVSLKKGALVIMLPRELRRSHG